MPKKRKKLTRKDKIALSREQAAKEKAAGKAKSDRLEALRKEALAQEKANQQADADRKVIQAAAVSTDEDGDLLDIISTEATNDPRFCSSAFYAEWEKNVAEPELRKAGYIPTRWRTADGDSFGPLIRVVDLVKDGVRRTYYYG